MAQSPSLDGITVLLVDDDPDALALVGTLSRDDGADVTAVAKVEDALRALQTGRPRVVVSDLVIPGHDGFTLIRRIRRLGKEQVHALEEGFDEYLAKPVHERIVQTVARMASPSRR